MSKIIILETKTSLAEIKELAKAWYENMIKGSVDIDRDRVAVGGDYHIESCEVLVSDGSNHENVWGFNIRFNNGSAEVEFDSLINIKPQLGNTSRSIANMGVVEKASKIIKGLVELV